MIRRWWCRFVHPEPMWPIHGHYQCRTCQMRWPVAWEQDEKRERLAEVRA